MIGQQLCKDLKKLGISYRVLSRTPKADHEFLWNLHDNYIDENALIGITDIIHLAGAGIADKRWSNSRKRELVHSRTQPPRLLFDKIEELGIELNSFVSASGVGYYGLQTEDKIYTELDHPTKEFISECVLKWEAAANKFKPKTRVVCLRMGLIVQQDQGAIKKMGQPVKWRVGTYFGNGKQWMPWADVRDASAAFIYALQNNISGSYNVVSSQHINQKEFMTDLALSLNRRLLPFSVPAWFLRLILGEMSVLLLSGNRMSNQKLLETGFTFEFEELKKALS